MRKSVQGQNPQIFNPPALASGLLERTRLYRLIDQAPKNRPLYIWGPPGVGKSTLVASYLRAGALPAVWYPITGSEQNPEALLTQLLTRLKGQPSPAILVLDDYHRALDNLHPILNAVARATGARIILISRSDPPCGLRGALSDGNSGHHTLTRVGWRQLRLTRSEARQLARLSGSQSIKAAHALHGACGGWIAGFCHLQKNAVTAENAHHVATNCVSNYLGGTLQHTPISPPKLGPPGPWQVAIHALSSFAIHTPSGPLRHYRKPPRRPMELLKRLLAAGPGGEAEEKIMSGLWPTSKRDAAVRALATTLHRLRALLGDRSMVLREGGWLRLDASRIWVDAWVLESALAPLPAPTEFPTALPDHQVQQLITALALYRAPLLSGEGDLPWLLAPRQRLHGRVLHQTIALGGHQESTLAWADAEATYHQGIATDPTAETLYRGLMRALAAQGRTTDVIDAYRRLNTALKEGPGNPPSHTTIDLYHRLTADIPEKKPIAFGTIS
jgi:DNA-binding SARP family transcriptional activator